jgi:hypothetical protein
MKLSLLRSEHATEVLRWSGGFITVVLVYGVAGWFLLRSPNPPESDVGAPLLLDLPDRQAPPERTPADRTPAPDAEASRSDPEAQDVAKSLAGAGGAGGGGGAAAATAGEREIGSVPVGGGAERTNEGGAAADPRLAAIETAGKTAADQSGRAPQSETASKTEGPGDSGGGANPSAAPHNAVRPDNTVAPAGGAPQSIARDPIDTRITVNQGRPPLRNTKGLRPFREVALPNAPQDLKSLKALKDLKEHPFKNAIPGAGTAIPGAGSAPNNDHHNAQAASHSQGSPAGADGAPLRNAIGAVIENHHAQPRGAPGVAGNAHFALGTPSGGMQASGGLAGGMQVSAGPASGTLPAGASAGAPVGALAIGGAVNRSETSLSAGAGHSSPMQIGDHDPATHSGIAASIGGPAINGTGMSHPPSGTGMIGGPAKVAGVLNGTAFHPRHP